MNPNPRFCCICDKRLNDATRKNTKTCSFLCRRVLTQQLQRESRLRQAQDPEFLAHEAVNDYHARNKDTVRVWQKEYTRRWLEKKKVSEAAQ